MIDQEKLEQKWKRLSSDGKKSRGPRLDFNPLLNPPRWYDPERFRRSQQLAKKYFLSLNIAHFIGNILLIHLPDVLVPVIATGNSKTPFLVFKRILSTMQHMLTWYDDDPFDPTTITHRSMLQVRRNCHMAVSNLMNKKYPRSHGRFWLNQFDMAMTQWAEIGIVGIRPKECGFHHTTKEEFLEYFYFWRVIGYCVGIEDQYNICGEELNGYDEHVEFLRICYERCYKKHLDEKSKPVLLGMEMTKGIFLVFESILPRCLICYETFMKYWYDSLEVQHSIELNSIQLKIYYKIMIWILESLLKIQWIYSMISWLFFKFQKNLFKNLKFIKNYCDENLNDIQYKLNNEYFDDPIVDPNEDKSADSNHNPEKDSNSNDNPENDSKDSNSNDLSSTNPDQQQQQQPYYYYEINNYFYKTNVHV